MAVIKSVIRKIRADGFCVVYFRVTHHRQAAYIKTDKVVSAKDVSKSGEITDPYVMKFCMERIVEFQERLNKVDIEHWPLAQVVSYLKKGDDDICFSDYAREHIDRMINAGQIRNAKNYQLALGHMERYAGTTKIMFSQLTSLLCNAWIKTLEKTHRAKEMYPICLRQVFKAAMVEYNDYDLGVIRIKTNPWPKVKIPSADRPQKLAISPAACRSFFAAPIPESKLKSPVPELGHDVALLVFCLAGINTIDIYELKKSDYYDGIIHYKRAKTKKARADEAYMEMRVPEFLMPTFEKYLDKSDAPELFTFASRFRNADSFNANVNIGIRAICASMGIAKEEDYCVYTFRHTWGTIAQNRCGATIDEVAFGMNHSNGHNVTRGYLKLDFSPAWELNEKVIEVVFGDPKKEETLTEPESEPVNFKLSPKYMVRATASLKNRLLAEVHDIGFSNIDEVIEALVEQFPDTLPMQSKVKFKIVNQDKEQVWIGERSKGKGF